jgi:hypothetical protein
MALLYFDTLKIQKQADLQVIKIQKLLKDLEEKDKE